MNKPNNIRNTILVLIIVTKRRDNLLYGYHIDEFLNISFRYILNRRHFVLYLIKYIIVGDDL